MVACGVRLAKELVKIMVGLGSSSIIGRFISWIVSGADLVFGGGACFCFCFFFFLFVLLFTMTGGICRSVGGVSGCYCAYSLYWEEGIPVMSGYSSSWSVWACERRSPWSKRSKRTKKKEVASRRSCVGSVLEKLVISNALRENFQPFSTC